MHSVDESQHLDSAYRTTLYTYFTTLEQMFADVFLCFPILSTHHSQLMALS